MHWRALLVVALQQSRSEEFMGDGQDVVRNLQSLWPHFSPFACCCSICSGMCTQMCGLWSVFEGRRQPSARDLPWDGEDVRSRQGVMCQS